MTHCKKKIVDLTMPLKTGAPVFPGYPTPIVHQWTSIEKDGYYSNLLMFVEHTGTHVDAPAHFVKDGATIDEVPLDRFMGKGVLVDVRDLPPKGMITADLIKSRASIGENSIVLFLTGYDKKAGTDEWFEHPGLDESAAKYLAEKNVKAVGIDAPSIDHTPFPAHNILLPKGIVIYENLTNLEALLSAKNFCIIGIPLKIFKGSASPVRVIAKIEE
ncbi:cyclase family protein [Thermococcus barophilus]|uniref:Metal dependent hydrolase n=1 Tax=Thermococcus barophilus TaxID=55802 RepID=A0A0S1XA62_THEBA|nr:cyclase family protein [Thermococcus barophilus]ALM74644.1 metal dependent hydrolase [Thermococcus barophilus]